MKKTLAVLLAVLLVSLAAAAPAEEMKEYRDNVYAFRYPASWSQDTSSSGDIVLLSPGGKEAVLTFALLSDVWHFTGDAEADAPTIEDYISSYGGKNLQMNGEYELIQSGELHGFRAPGSWRSTGQAAVMLLLSSGTHIVGFVLVGDGAIALEQDFLGSVELLGGTQTGIAEGFKHWEDELFSLDYPENYLMMGQETGVVFGNPEKTNCIIMARSYSLNYDYDDSMAVSMVATALPKSAKVEANAETIEIGGKNAAVIRGTVSDGPMEFYLFGSGRTAVAMMFLGEEACGMAETVIGSAQIK